MALAIWQQKVQYGSKYNISKADTSKYYASSHKDDIMHPFC